MGSGVLPLAMATRLFQGSGVRDQDFLIPALCLTEASCVCLQQRRLPPRPDTWSLIPGDLVLAAGCGAPVHRAISTGQLRGLPRFHLRPIDVVVYHGSRRDLVLRKVSRLDAFSGYPVRT